MAANTPSPTLGRLERVTLREIWGSESTDFTPWLAQETNLDLLGEAIGIELELEAQEKEVGPFRADILCRDASTDKWVLIENQLERTDHSHLGQLLTYAAGLEAVTIVWISQTFTEEHRAALDWLNEHTDESINLFGLEIELWRIGGSPVAPKFNIVSQPNNWSRSVQKVANDEISPHKQQQLQFWTAFRDYMSRHSKIGCHKPQPQHWMNHSIGRSGFHLASITSSWNSETSKRDPEIRVELILNNSHAKRYFEVLSKQRAEIDRAVGGPLVWHNPEGKTMCRLYQRTCADISNEADWPNQHKWLREKLELFAKVFGPIVRDIDRE
jgi:hypothetical protein